MSQPIGNLAHYRILQEVGQGGMGVVYKAHDTSLDRLVAIKVMPAAVSSDPELRSRFLAEARHAARISHPNIATVHQVDEAELSLDTEHRSRTVLYIAMEFIDGADLEEKMLSGAMTLDETLDIAIQISAGLEAAHAQKVVHRDLKPHNILLAEDGRVKIVDFGLAKSFRDDGGISPGEPTQIRPQLTRTGMMVGTPGYMAPEQAEGTEVDSRTDLFSLGILLYRMTSGKLPFSNTNYVKFLRALLSEEPEPLANSNPAIPGELQLIVERLLQKDPEQRFQSAHEVRLALRRLAGGSTDELTVGLPTPPITSSATRVRSPGGRKWQAFGLTALALLLVVAAGLWRWSISANRSSAAPLTIAVRFLGNVNDAEIVSHCRQLSEQLRRRLGQTPGIVTTTSEVVSKNAVDQENLEYVTLEFSCSSKTAPTEIGLRMVDPSSQLTLWDRSFLFKGIPEDWQLFSSELAFQAARAAKTLAMARTIDSAGSSPQRLADFLSSFDEAVRQLENHNQPSTLPRAIAQFEELASYGQGFGPAITGLHEALYRRHRGTPQPAVDARLSEIANRAIRVAPELPGSKIAQARVAFINGAKKEAYSVLENLIESDSDAASASYELGIFLKKDGHYERAKLSYSRAIRLRPGFWRYRYQLGAVLLAEHDLAAARHILRQAARLAPPEVNRPAISLAVNEIVVGNFAEALSAINLLPPPIVSVYHANTKATALFYLRQFADAEPLFRLAADIEPEDPSHRAALGDSLLMLGRTEEAHQAYEVALKNVEHRLAINENDLRSLVWKPAYLAKLGRCNEALSLQRDLPTSRPADAHLLNTMAKTYALCQQIAPATRLLRQVLEKGISIELLRNEIEFREYFDDPLFEKSLGRVTDRRTQP